VAAPEHADATGGGSDFGGAPSTGGSGPQGGIGGRRLAPDHPIVVVGGAGGGTCEGGLRILQTIEQAPMEVIALSDQRLAWLTHRGSIQVYDASGLIAGDPLVLLAELTAETLGLAGDGEWSLGNLRKYGDGVRVSARRGALAKAFFWQLGTAAVELDVPPDFTFASLADPVAGLVSGSTLIDWAIERDGNWTLVPPFGDEEHHRTPLAFDGDDLLVGLQESNGSFGEAGAAGTAGWTAAVERWNAHGELVASYPAVGDPRVATAVDGGWLIGETNSFWGSYNAALEWLAPGAQRLQNLTDVPVISADDSGDGTFGVAMNGRTVFLANCESGLLFGKWQGNVVKLTGSRKAEDSWLCDPTSVHALGDLLVIGGRRLEFAMLCDD
jgi:hypothetical protein